MGALFLAGWVEDGVAECRDLMTADGASALLSKEDRSR